MPKKTQTTAISRLMELKKEASLLVNDPLLTNEDFANITAISSTLLTDEDITPNKILEIYLKVLVSLMPDAELLCKKKITEYNVKALTLLGDALRQTINELEIYKDPKVIIEEKIAPSIQIHHDEVIRKIANCTFKLKDNFAELLSVDKQKQAQNLLIEYLKTLGEDLRITYSHTLEKLEQDLLRVKGL